MNTQRLESLFREAGVDLDTAHTLTPENLTELATRALELLGIEADEIGRINESLQGSAKTSALAVGIGAGLSAFALATAAPFLDLALDAGARLATFFIENSDIITAGWDVLTPPLATLLTEAVLHLPGGTIDVGGALADAAHIAHELVSAALSDGGHLGDIVHAITMAADAVDLADIVTTFGLSIAIGWIAGKIVEEYYMPKMEALKTRIARIQEQQAGLECLKQALRLKLPSTLIVPLLENTAPHHWGL